MFHRRLFRPAIAVVLCVFFYAFIWTNLPWLQFRKLRNPFIDQLPIEMVTDSKAGSVTAKNETTKVLQMEDMHKHSAKNSQDILEDKKQTRSIGTKISTAIKPTNKGNPSMGIFKKVHDITEIAPLNIKDFKAAPLWDFEDSYLRNPHPTNTICKQSLRNSNDTDFKVNFIPDIQVFMQKDHLNLSVWNKLAHFNNPFGVMGYNYSVVKEAVKLIPDLKDFQLLPVPKTDKEGCIRCAVVGTGGILNGSKMGKEIDSHDYVFRMNGAVLKGFEDDVGNKTSVYVHTAHSLTSAHYTLKKYGFKHIPADEGIKYVFLPEGLRDFYWLQGLLKEGKVPAGQYRNLRPEKYYPANFNVSRFYVLHPDFLRYIRIRFMLSKQLRGTAWRYYRPTNGAFTLFLALHTCDIVDAYGFITANHAKYSNYYYEKIKSRVVFYINHDYNLEIKTWKKLHDAKLIRLYQGKEDPPDKV